VRSYSTAWCTTPDAYFLLDLNTPNGCEDGTKPWSMCGCGCGCVAGTPDPLQATPEEDCIVMFNSKKAELNGVWEHSGSHGPAGDTHPFYTHTVNTQYKLVYFEDVGDDGYYITDSPDWQTNELRNIITYNHDWMVEYPPTPTRCGGWYHTDDDGRQDEDMTASFCALAPDLAAAAMEEISHAKHEEMYCWKCKELLGAMALLAVIVVIVVWRWCCRAKSAEKFKIEVECEEDEDVDAELDEIEIEVEMEVETGIIAGRTATQ